MPKVRVGDINMYYEIHGEGEPLVFINGRNMCADLLYRHIPVFAKEYRVMVFDNRGTGKSDAPDVPYSLEMMAKDLKGLMEVIGIEKAHLAGYSMGARIAEEMALSYPESINSLILVCPITWSVDIPWLPAKAPEEEVRKWQALSQKEQVWMFLRRVVSEEFIENNRDLAEKMAQIILEGQGPPLAQKWHAHASETYDNYKRLPHIKVPTLILAGREDRTVPLDNINVLKDKLPGAELAVMDKMGHFMMWEGFEESNEIMLDFLQRHSNKK